MVKQKRRLRFVKLCQVKCVIEGSLFGPVVSVDVKFSKNRLKIFFTSVLHDVYEFWIC